MMSATIFPFKDGAYPTAFCACGNRAGSVTDVYDVPACTVLAIGPGVCKHA
jgi:hypothetical protein